MPLRSFTMNGLVAFLANYQRLAAACGHPLDPERLLAPAWLGQIRQRLDQRKLHDPVELPQLMDVEGRKTRTACSWGRCVRDAVAAGVHFHRWRLGFRQSSFHR